MIFPIVNNLLKPFRMIGYMLKPYFKTYIYKSRKTERMEFLNKLKAVHKK